MWRERLKEHKFILHLYYLFRYLIFNIKLISARIKDWFDRKDSRYKNLPPPRLRHRVHGALDKPSFLQIGRNLSQDLHDLCMLAGSEIYSFNNILDFGCGSGRVLRFLQNAPRSFQFYGTDIDTELVEWCKKTYPNTHWNRNAYMPPLDYNNDFFDFVYAISVFTHLDETYQHAWLKELKRIAKPGALIILSVLGESYANALTEADKKQLRLKGFLYIKSVSGMLKIDGLPDFYQATYHTRAYIEKEWSKYFDLIHYVERGINNRQDAVLLRVPGD
jgi:SAM-dependent methyltransferase